RALLERTRFVTSRLRAGSGPWFFEVQTYRWREHVGPNDDFNLGYRTRDEANPFQANDAVVHMAQRLPTAERNQIEQEVEQEIADAFAFAEQSPFPTDADLLTAVCVEN